MAVARTTTRSSRLAFWATGASVYVFWNLATLIGALSAHALSNPRVLGLDAAAPAAFLALMSPRLAIARTVGRRVDGGRGRADFGAVRADWCASAVRRWGCSDRGRPTQPWQPRRTLRRRTLMWLAIAVGCVGCFALKLVGYSLPRRVIEQPVVKHIAELLPVALLTALIATQTFTTGHHLQLDARAAGLRGRGNRRPVQSTVSRRCCGGMRGDRARTGRGY